MILYYAVKVVISGIEYTRHVNFAAGRQDVQLVKHSYQVENLGKRSLPLQVRFTVPGKIGTNTLWNVTVSERKPGNRSSCQLSAKSLAKVQTEAPRDPQDYLMLDCGITKCLELQCEVTALEEHGTVIFDIQGEFMSAALAELDAMQLMLFSKAKLRYDEEKYVDVSEESAHYYEATLLTEVDIVQQVNQLPLIIGGSVGGLVLLLIVIFVFFKFGFFKRSNNSGERESLKVNPSEGGETPSTGEEMTQE
ncbi:integrin alpha-X-like [Cetorhinus maximus]